MEIILMIIAILLCIAMMFYSARNNDNFRYILWAGIPLIILGYTYIILGIAGNLN